jgi:hypothetical protein
MENACRQGWWCKMRKHSCTPLQWWWCKMLKDSCTPLQGLYKMLKDSTLHSARLLFRSLHATVCRCATTIGLAMTSSWVMTSWVMTSWVQAGSDCTGLLSSHCRRSVGRHSAKQRIRSNGGKRQPQPQPQRPLNRWLRNRHRLTPKRREVCYNIENLSFLPHCRIILLLPSEYFSCP